MDVAARPKGGDAWPATARPLAAALLWLLTAAGCANHSVYKAAQLPADLQAPPTVNVRTLDLSHLAGPPVSKELIECGDVIKVSIAAGLSADDVTELPVRVSEDGTALLPEIGPIPVAGLNLTAAEQAISATCAQRGFYRRPQVTVTMQQQRLNRITVVGAVKVPGVKELPRASSYVLSAIVVAGGLAEDAGPRVEIRCPTGRSILSGQPAPAAGPSGVQLTAGAEPVGADGVAYVCLNLAESVSQGAGSRYLPDGSVVHVETREPQPYHVIGLVEKPGQYEFPVNHDLRVLGAIAQAGGISQALADKVYVIRARPDRSEDVVVQLSLRQAKRQRQENIRLQPGDIVSVEYTPSTVLVEAIRNLPFHLGASVPIF